jgi:hypothetical protein
LVSLKASLRKLSLGRGKKLTLYGNSKVNEELVISVVPKPITVLILQLGLLQLIVKLDE